MLLTVRVQLCLVPAPSSCMSALPHAVAAQGCTLRRRLSTREVVAGFRSRLGPGCWGPVAAPTLTGPETRANDLPTSVQKLCYLVMLWGESK